MSVWLFDLGNTRLKFAELQAEGRPGPAQAIAHAGEDFEHALARALPAHIDVAHVASVAPASVRMALLHALVARSTRIGFARTQAFFAGVRIAYAEPQRLGVDRFLALVAAHARGGPVLVCGVGTALTLDLVDADGQHRGGRIAPSPTLMRESLHARAAQLPEAGGHFAAFANDTVDALASGCEGAAIALVQDSLEAARVLLGDAPRLVLHGGGGAALRVHFPQADWLDAPVLDGLATWAGIEQPTPVSPR